MYSLICVNFSQYWNKNCYMLVVKERRYSVLVFLSNWGGTWVMSRFWQKFPFSLMLKILAFPGKLIKLHFICFLSKNELLLAKLGYLLLACNQSFSTFPIWFWDISDLYIFDDLVLTWWIVFIVMEALPCPYLKYLMIIFLIFFEVFGLLGPFSTCLVFLLYTPEVWWKILNEFFLWAIPP